MTKEAPAKLTTQERTLARTRLMTARGKKRLDIILSSPEPRSLLHSLPADDLYFMIREIGLAEAAALVPLASPSQFAAFIDLDCWRSSDFDIKSALPWFRAARSGIMQDDDAARRWEKKLSKLDPELLHLIFREMIRVHDLEQDPDPELESDRFMRTPEGKYVIEFIAEGTDYIAVRGIVDDLIAAEPLTATRLFSSTPFELPTELSESALRWRTARMADLGYPTLDEALSWFSRPPKAAATKLAAPPARPDGFFLTIFTENSLLDQAAEMLTANARDRLEREMIASANAVLIADRVDPHNLDGVQSAFKAARALIEIGLATLSNSDVERAGPILAETALKRLFQEGFGRTLNLKWRAEKIVSTGGAGTREEPTLGSPMNETIWSLISKRPKYYPGVELPREDWETPAAGVFEARPFLSIAELERTEKVLQKLEVELSEK